MEQNKDLFLDYGELIFYHRFNNETLSRAHNLALSHLDSQGYEVGLQALSRAHNDVIQRYLQARKADNSEWPMSRIIGEVSDLMGTGSAVVPTLVDVYKLHDHDYWPMETTAMSLPVLAKDQRLHIISNIPHDSLYTELREHGMYEFFDTFTLSCDVGVRKPHQEIYLSAMRKAGTTIFIPIFNWNIISVPSSNASRLNSITQNKDYMISPKP